MQSSVQIYLQLATHVSQSRAVYAFATEILMSVLGMRMWPCSACKAAGIPSKHICSAMHACILQRSGSVRVSVAGFYTLDSELNSSGGTCSAQART